MTEVKSLNNENLVSGLKRHVAEERKIMAIVIEHISEVWRRRLYIDLGYTSLFKFLTVEIGYCDGSVQARIDCAKIFNEVPSLGEDLRSGELALSKVALVAQSVRQKEAAGEKVATEQKVEILNSIKGKSKREAEFIVAQELDIEIKQHERLRVQQDESVRLEMTFTKAEMAELTRVKELMSHIKPGASMAEVIVHAAKEFIRRKDPLVQNITAADEVPETKAVPLRVKMAVIQRDKCCQWRHEGRLCGSTFQLEVDHRQSLWAGGDHRIENLQALCSVHNQLKYRREAGIRYR